MTPGQVITVISNQPIFECFVIFFLIGLVKIGGNLPN